MNTLQATILSNTGLHLRYGGSSILLDVLNGSIFSFQELAPDLAAEVIAGTGVYANITGLVYTHLHPDHYDQAKNEAFLNTHPGVATFFPTDQTPDHGVFQMGEFTVEYQRFTHTPCDYPCPDHFVLWVTAGENHLYFTADADLNPALHHSFLRERRATYGFFNPMYLSSPETRKLLRDAAEHIFIYHVPVAQTDQSGICRKLERNLQRYGTEFSDLTVLGQYPTDLI